jgi:hypothetical protein
MNGDPHMAELRRLQVENRIMQQRITKLENAIRNEPEFPGSMGDEMFYKIKSLDKKGIEEWCRIIVRQVKNSMWKNAAA